MLKKLTRFDGVSLQPSSGSNGELSGLIAIRRYHDFIGEGYRNICLIPSSAHGTNPASSVMAGLKVVVVNCDKDGNISFEDLISKAQKHKKDLCCLMVTYPSTHGVYEEQIKDITDIIHKYGGQVYMDGANMNAQFFITSPNNIGADVCHLNLHKSFAIPHGGGGPGIGPICVKEHLKHFLPGHVEIENKNPLISNSNNSWSVASAPYGSAGIIPVSYLYMKMLAKDLAKVTQYSILNANYIMTRLKKAFPILYKGARGYCAHEFIIDLRKIKVKLYF